jgi:uncharacterized membrane protein YhaH (DUF805 family)
MIELLFSFAGRLNRRPLWGFWLFTGLIGLVCFHLIYRQLAQTPFPAEMTPEDFAARMKVFNWINAVNLILLWPTLALGVKRCHDRGRSGWFLLLMLVPLVQLWPIIELAFLRGTAGENRFGPDPLEGHAHDGWKSWAIFLGLVVVFALQGNVAFNMIVLMQNHMPKMQGPGVETPGGAPGANPNGLRPATPT